MCGLTGYNIYETNVAEAGAVHHCSGCFCFSESKALARDADFYQDLCFSCAFFWRGRLKSESAYSRKWYVVTKSAYTVETLTTY